MPNSLVIFDLDGTLFRTDSVTVPAVQESFKDFGLSPPVPDVILGFIGQPISALARWARETCPAESVDRLMAEIDRRELELVQTAGRLFEGAVEALAALRNDYGSLAICTNGQSRYVHDVLDATQIRQHFDLVRYRREDDISKTGMVRDVVRRLNAQRAVVVGDRADDVRAAKDNGLGSVGAGYGFGSPGELDDADAVAESIGHVPDLVRSLFEGLGQGSGRK